MTSIRARLCLLLLLVAFVGAGVTAPAAVAAQRGATATVAGPKPVISTSAILVDASTGAVLWSRGATTPRRPASLTKMLTALLVRATLPLSTVAVTTRDAAKAPPTKLALKPGEKITVGQALQALMVVSANDMAVLLADRSAGSAARFQRAMNAESRLLGLRQSSWQSTNGLDTTGLRSSALDLAILARAVLLDPWLARVVRTPKVVFTTPDRRRHELYAHSRFLRDYKGAIGVKTGFTDDAGHCLAAAATRNGRTLIAVVLSSTDPAGDAARLMDWGFGPGRGVRSHTFLPPYVAPMGVRTLLTPPPATTTATTTAPPAAAVATATPAQLRDRVARWSAGAGAAGVALLGGTGLVRRHRRRYRRRS
jgi:D-alanyl-D-alanine carboxypeptidase